MKKVLDRIKQARADHKERHRPTGFEFALSDRIGLLSGDAWQSVTRNASIFMQREVLQAIESAGPREIGPRYALISEAGRPVVALAAQMVSLNGGRLVGESAAPPEPEKKKPLKAAAMQALKQIGKKAVRKVDSRILVGGNLMAWGNHGIAMAEGEDPARLWPAVAEAVLRIRRAEGLFEKTDYVLIKDIPAPNAASTEPLRRFGYRPVETDPDMHVAIPETWRTYDDYLAGLNSRYRKSAKGLHPDVETGGYVVETLTDIDPHAARLHQLYMNVHQKAAVRPITAPDTYLPALARAAGPDRFRCTVVRKGDHLAGFVTTLRDGPTAIGYYIGIDYEVNEQIPVYLRLLHATVADAISLGCTRLSLGRTALEPKARLGAKPVPLTVWVRHRIPLMNVLLRPIFDAIPHDEAPERTVMK